VKLNTTDVQIIDTLYDRHPRTTRASELTAWVTTSQSEVYRRLRWLAHYGFVHSPAKSQWELTEAGLRLRDGASMSASAAPAELATEPFAWIETPAA
jgi:DNA-binding IclR family transcriptional regulator